MQRAACPRLERDGCPVANEKSGCYGDTHHHFYPASAYRTDVEKAFRELPENKEFICRNDHNERHATIPVPEKPCREDMLRALGWSMVGGEVA